MIDDESVDEAYEPPEADDDEAERTRPPEADPQPRKLAGTLLLIAGSIDVACWAADQFVHMTPRWWAMCATLGYFGFGAGLRRWGELLRWPTFAFFGLVTAIPLVYIGVYFRQLGIPLSFRPLIYPLASDFLRFAPICSLLLGRPGRRRIKLALVGFVASELLEVTAWGFGAYFATTLRH